MVSEFFKHFQQNNICLSTFHVPLRYLLKCEFESLTQIIIKITKKNQI